MIYADLILNLSLLVALSVVSGVVQEHTRRLPRVGALLQGGLFGGAAVIGMLSPLELGPGLILDSCSVVVSLCALFYGSWAALVAVLMSGAGRVVLAGMGTLPGVLIILSSAGIGLLIRRFFQPVLTPISPWRLYLFGLAIHGAMLAMMFSMPIGTSWLALGRISMPVITWYPLVTVLVGKLLSDQLAKAAELAAQRRLLASLKGSEKNIRSLLDAIPESAFLIDIDGTVLALNQTTARRLDKDADEMLGKNIYAFIPETVGHRRRRKVETVIQTQQAVTFEDKRQDRWLLNSVNPVLNESGEVVRLAVVGVDLTEHKRTEEALRQSETNHRQIFESLLDGLIVFDPKGRVKYVNPSACAMYGYPQEEFVELSGKDIVHPDYYPHFKQFLQSIHEPQKFVVESRDVRKDGSSFWNEVRGLPFFFDGSEHLLAVVRDISDRKQADAERKRLISAIEFTQEIIVVTDALGAIQYVNPAFEKITGYTAQEVLGGNPRLLKSGVQDQRFYQTLWQTITAGTTWNGRLVNKRKNGTLYTEEAVISPVFNESGDISNFVAVKRDISQKIDFEKRAAHAQRVEAIGALAGGIAHDFNNLLFPIIGMSEMLLEDLPTEAPHRDNVTEIHRAALRAGDLVKQILSFSRQSDHRKIPVRIQHILKEVLKLSRATIPSNIKIEQNNQKDCGMVMADPTQLHQIAMNLITNAYHAVQDTGGTIKVGLREVYLNAPETAGVSLSPGRYAKLTVSDNGCGIAPEVMNRIFEPYFTTKEKDKGTGLGLSVVYGIVKEHQGDVVVSSRAGQGAVFAVYLPVLDKESPDEIPDQTERIYEGNNEKILLVDDEEAVVRLEKQMLRRLGYQVMERTSSVEALEAFKTNPAGIDLVITDMTMPNMTGDQLAAALIALKPDLPVIICTGFSERLNKEKARAMGIKGFLMKPVVKTQLAREVRNVLNRETTHGARTNPTRQ